MSCASYPHCIYTHVCVGVCVCVFFTCMQDGCICAHSIVQLIGMQQCRVIARKYNTNQTNKDTCSSDQLHQLQRHTHQHLRCHQTHCPSHQCLGYRCHLPTPPPAQSRTTLLAQRRCRPPRLCPACCSPSLCVESVAAVVNRAVVTGKKKQKIYKMTKKQNETGEWTSTRSLRTSCLI